MGSSECQGVAPEFDDLRIKLEFSFRNRDIKVIGAVHGIS